MRTTDIAVALLLTVTLAAYILLHFVEPTLSLTWSYAHLGRSHALQALAAVCVIGMPLLGYALSQRPAAMQPVGRWSSRSIAITTAILAAILIAVGATFPTPHFSIDVIYFVDAVRKETSDNGRWYLLLWFMEHIARWLRACLDTDQVIRAVNGIFSAVAVIALAGAARHLGRTRGEAASIFLIAVSAFGVAQLLIGYLDIYPMPLALTAVYVWTAFAAIDGVLHPAVPLAIAAIGPFWYIALVLLVPSTAVIAAVELRRPGGIRRLAVAGVAALAITGLATVPWFGWPFAWGAFLERARAMDMCELGFDPVSCLLPTAYMSSHAHLREILHAVLLVDGVGWILFAVCGLALVKSHRGPDAKAVLLGAVLLACVAYLVAYDPLFGPYADWDLFSYSAVASGLLGGWAIVAWGREFPRARGALIGLALAAACVHLLARLHALDVDLQRHLAESPYHIPTK